MTAACSGSPALPTPLAAREPCAEHGLSPKRFDVNVKRRAKCLRIELASSPDRLECPDPEWEY